MLLKYQFKVEMPYHSYFSNYTAGSACYCIQRGDPMCHMSETNDFEMV